MIDAWLKDHHRSPFLFQQQAWEAIMNGRSGLVNAPTGCGKTYSVFLGAIIQFINNNPDRWQTCSKNGLQLLWITPLRALAKDIGRAMEEVIGQLGMNWRVGIRNGDTTLSDREKQKRNMPEVLIITPESLHLMLASKGYIETFSTLKIMAIDEWHELLGSKRGVQVELAVSRINGIRESQRLGRKVHGALQAEGTTGKNGPDLQLWGISATIGNLEEAKEVLLAPLRDPGIIIRANIAKKIEVESVFPDEIEKYPWAGHLSTLR